MAYQRLGGRTNLFYLPKYFRKVEGERKGKNGRKRQFNSIGPTFGWMATGLFLKSSIQYCDCVTCGFVKFKMIEGID
jgi:hypothetical protein